MRGRLDSRFKRSNYGKSSLIITTGTAPFEGTVGRLKRRQLRVVELRWIYLVLIRTPHGVSYCWSRDTSMAVSQTIYIYSVNSGTCIRIWLELMRDSSKTKSNLNMPNFHSAKQLTANVSRSTNPTGLLQNSRTWFKGTVTPYKDNSQTVFVVIHVYLVLPDE